MRQEESVFNDILPKQDTLRTAMPLRSFKSLIPSSSWETHPSATVPSNDVSTVAG